MPKHIDADAIKNDIKTLWDWKSIDGIKSSTVLKQVLSDIDNINESVVRCKNCTYAEVGKNDVWCNFYLTFKHKDGFCDEGKRKETEKFYFVFPFFL